MLSQAPLVDETCILKVDSFRIFCVMIFPESLHASDEVSGPIFCKLFRIYIYIQTFTRCLYVSNGKCIFYEFYVSLNVYLQCTMFDFDVMNGKYAKSRM